MTSATALFLLCLVVAATVRANSIVVHASHADDNDDRLCRLSDFYYEIDRAERAVKDTEDAGVVYVIGMAFRMSQASEQGFEINARGEPSIPVDAMSDEQRQTYEWYVDFRDKIVRCRAHGEKLEAAAQRMTFAVKYDDCDDALLDALDRLVSLTDSIKDEC